MCNELLNNKEYINIQTSEKLELKQVYTLPSNTLLKHNSELWCEWDFEKNAELGFDIWKMAKSSGKKAHWICKDCKSEYDSKIYSRTNSSACPYCAGQKVNHTNSLASLNPELASEWHPTLNGELTPHDVTVSSGKKVWWLGTCGHFWDARIADRNRRKDECPYCINKKVWIGFNDMWTTNPEQASWLLNPEDGYKYIEGSHTKTSWKCPCGNFIKNKKIYDVNRRGLCCIKCSDGKSYPEKFITALLSKLNLEFIHDSTYEWSNGKRYDFYIPSLSLIIETHGAQHYYNDKAFSGRKLEEEIENDIYKRELAINNGVIFYVELNCSESDLSFISNSIEASQLSELFNLNKINYKELHKESLTSMICKVCSYYNENNNIEQKHLSKIFNISDKTVREYLKMGNQIGLCEYIPNNKQTKDTSVEHMRIKVVQLSKNGEFIKFHNSIKDAGVFLNKTSHSSISANCKGKSKSAYGYKWMYLSEYEKMIKEQNKIS